MHFSLCGSRKYPYSPQVRSLKIPRGALRAKLLEENYRAKLEFPGGEGVQNEKPSMGGVYWNLYGTLLSVLCSLDKRSCPWVVIGGF